jgi:hypothetical protein
MNPGHVPPYTKEIIKGITLKSYLYPLENSIGYDIARTKMMIIIKVNFERGFLRLLFFS